MTGRAIRIGSLPDFNAGDPDFIVEHVEGYMDGAAPQPVLVASGGGAGAIAVGSWAPTEEYLTVSGSIFADRDGLYILRRMLIDAFTGERESPLVVLGGGVDVDKQMFVRLYDRRSITQLDDRLTFSLPLVAPDPYKYAVAPLGGDMGAFVSQQWYREYRDAAGVWVREYANTGGVWSRSYQQAVPDGPYPTSLTLQSPGDATSRRVTVTVHGPLSAGEWTLRNESTGEQMWVDLSVIEGQELVLDTAARSARLNGEDVGHLVFGDFLTLAPGDNLFRLATGSASDAYATVSALPAYL